MELKMRVFFAADMRGGAAMGRNSATAWPRRMWSSRTEVFLICYSVASVATLSSCPPESALFDDQHFVIEEPGNGYARPAARELMRRVPAGHQHSDAASLDTGG